MGYILLVDDGCKALTCPHRVAGRLSGTEWVHALLFNNGTEWVHVHICLFFFVREIWNNFCKKETKSWNWRRATVMI